MDELALSKLRKRKSEIKSEIPEERRATARACCLVFVRNVMIAPIRGIRIINEIKAAIYIPPVSLSKTTSKKMPSRVTEA